MPFSKYKNIFHKLIQDEDHKGQLKTIQKIMEDATAFRQTNTAETNN